MGTRILVAGATGTLGRPLVAALVDAGHEVVGLTRTAAKERAVERLGATAVVADALDAEATLSAVRQAAPEVVVHLLTALPTGGPTKASHFDATNRLRRTGTANLLAAATAAGARRFVAESVVYAFGFGDHGTVPLTELAPLRPPGRADEELVSAARTLEQQVTDASRREQIEGIVLRYGLVYGAGAGSTLAMAGMLRKRRMPLIGDGDGVASWIHVSDAVRATAAAIDRGRPGEIYHIVDDEPVAWRDYLPHMAQVVGAPAPRALPVWLARVVAPYGARFMTTRLPVANGKARRQLAWTPALPSYLAGLAELGATRATVTGGA
jgi:nucleoside-diphosphate-sugar epimerase